MIHADKAASRVAAALAGELCPPVTTGVQKALEFHFLVATNEEGTARDGSSEIIPRAPELIFVGQVKPGPTKNPIQLPLINLRISIDLAIDDPRRVFVI
jgi:hypothetical protein